MPDFKICFFLGLLASTCLSSTALGQSSEEFTEQTEYQSNVKPPVQIEGNAKELSKSLRDAIITLFEDPDGSKASLVEIKKLVTKGNGKFLFNLDINNMYMVKLEKDGYTTKMVDFDTDVTMAASTESKVPKFMFDVDLVKDLDGLDYTGSVARVFYDIRKKSMAYELDYTKDEQVEEERSIRLAEEQQRLAQIEAQQKFEREEAAHLLLKTEGIEAAEIIKATATLGGDEAKVKKALLKIFPVSDTLRTKKTNIIYAELEKEKEKQGGVVAGIDFASIFKSAQNFEVEHIKEMDVLQEKRKVEIQNTALKVKQAQSEALAKSNAASQLEARERIAGAAANEELRQKEEKAKKLESYYQAIFSANGSPDIAIKNLEKVFGKDPYKKDKASAVYAEYENMRKTGSTLSEMDFDKLFGAASSAELTARESEMRTKDQSDSARLAAFMEKVETRKLEEEQETVKNIENAIKGSNGERAETIKALQQAFSKNDPYKEQKAQAMFESYAQNRQLNQGGSNYSGIDFNALFEVAKRTEESEKKKKKNKRFNEKQRQWEELEAKRTSVRSEKRDLGSESEQDAQIVHKQVIGEIRNRKYKELEDAIAKGEGDRQNTVEALMETLPKDAELKREKSEAMFDAYRLQRNQTTGVSNIRYQDLFAAADKREIELLELAYEEKKADQFAHLKKYEETRMNRAEEIANAKISQAEQEKQRAEEQYLAVAKKVEEERRARLEEEKKQQILFQREQFEDQNERLVTEQGRLDEIRANELAASKQRQNQIEAENIRKIEVQRKKQERLASERQKELDRLEQEKLNALNAQEKEESRLEKERLDKVEATTRLAAKQNEDRLKEAQRLEKLRLQDAQAAAKLGQKVEQQKLKEQERIATEKQEQLDAQHKADAARLVQQKEEDYLRYLTLGNQAFDQKDYSSARSNYEQGLLAKPNGKEINDKIGELESVEKLIAKAESEQRALDDKYNGHVETAELAFEVGNYEDAIKAYNRAIAEKPKETEPREKIEQIESLQEQLASAKKEEAAKEREYMLLMLDGDNLASSKQFELAKDKFNQALVIKPNEGEPKSKITEVDNQLSLIADATEKEQLRQIAAKQKFEAQQAEVRRLEQEEDIRLAAEREARTAAIRELDSQNEPEPVSDESAKQQRQRKYEDALLRVEELNLDAEQQRLAFLSELAQIYPEGLTEETVKGKNFTLHRHVANSSDVVTVYEKKIWGWGGVFYFKDTDIAITEALYKLELKAYK